MKKLSQQAVLDIDHLLTRIIREKVTLDGIGPSRFIQARCEMAGAIATAEIEAMQLPKTQRKEAIKHRRDDIRVWCWNALLDGELER